MAPQVCWRAGGGDEGPESPWGTEEASTCGVRLSYTPAPRAAVTSAGRTALEDPQATLELFMVPSGYEDMVAL